jgi:hypothetical protein
VRGLHPVQDIVTLPDRGIIEDPDPFLVNPGNHRYRLVLHGLWLFLPVPGLIGHDLVFPGNDILLPGLPVIPAPAGPGIPCVVETEIHQPETGFRAATEILNKVFTKTTT